VPKNRRKVIYGHLRKEVVIVLRKLCEYKGVKILEGKACIDHIHLCISVPPKYALSTMVGYLKGKSAMVVFEKYNKVKRNFKGHSFWVRGYYVSTVGLDEARVRKYIQDQEINDSVSDKYERDLSNPF
jgi:putative transposase